MKLTSEEHPGISSWRIDKRMACIPDVAEVVQPPLQIHVLVSPPSPSPAAAAPPAGAPSSGGPSPVDPTGVFQYGFPGPVSDLRAAPSLVSAFDRRTRNPAWVAEHITRDSLSRREGDRRYSVFY